MRGDATEILQDEPSFIPPIQRMNLVLIFIVVLVAIAIALAAAVAKRRPAGSPAKVDMYYLKNSLFSPAERSFFGVLEHLDFEGITITSKVRLADIFGVKKDLERGGRQRAFNRVNAKHVDFLLLQSSDGRPLIGIELDDRSHAEEDRAARDSFVDAVFASAGLPLLHIAARSSYDPKTIHRLVEEALQAKDKDACTAV